MPTLAISVHVQDPETGRHVVFHKGAEPPAKVVAMIKNPGVWEDPEEAAAVAEAFRAEDGFEEEVSADEVDGSDGEPPRSGRGSGREAWAAFAADRGVHVEDEDTRDDIVQALAEAGVIDE